MQVCRAAARQPSWPVGVTSVPGRMLIVSPLPTPSHTHAFAGRCWPLIHETPARRCCSCGTRRTRAPCPAGERLEWPGPQHIMRALLPPQQPGSLWRGLASAPHLPHCGLHNPPPSGCSCNQAACGTSSWQHRHGTDCCRWRLGVMSRCASRAGSHCAHPQRAQALLAGPLQGAALPAHAASTQCHNDLPRPVDWQPSAAGHGPAGCRAARARCAAAAAATHGQVG